MSLNEKNSNKFNLNFDNKVLRCLPIDNEQENYLRTVNNAIYSFVKPTPIKNPKLVSFSEKALKLIDLNKNDVNNLFIEYFSGNKILPGSQTAAQCYAGHQFGLYVGQLGDGAAIYLGEVINKKNERWEIQLKGAGPTPYSRFADGRKVLRSSVREFLCSEAIFNLGIPTTRAASCITSDDYVVRDIYYTGNPINERCTVICRIAETFIRFGTFEIFNKKDKLTGRFGPSLGRNDILTKLFDYVIDTFYSDISLKYIFENKEDIDKEKRSLRCKEFFKEITKKTAFTVALWQSYGFCHGVLNTDNMSILGLTLDYGPFAFMERFNPFFICNGSDNNGRYNFVNQPYICKWNLFKLAEVLQFSTSMDELTNILNENFYTYYNKFYFDKMRKKLGLNNELKNNLDNILCDKELIEKFLNMLEYLGADLTNSFRNLNLLKDIDKEDLIKDQINDFINKVLNQDSLEFDNLKKEDETMCETYNISYLLKLNEKSKDLNLFSNLIQRMEETKNFSVEDKKKIDREKLKSWTDSYILRIKYDLDGNLSEENLNKRIELMNQNNAKFILRNHIAQKAISLAENGEYSEINKILNFLQNPFEEIEINENNEFYFRIPNKNERCNKITCSS